MTWDRSAYRRPVALIIPLKKFSLPAAMNLPSVLILICMSALNRACEVHWEYTRQPPVISIGSVNAVRKLGRFGLSLAALYCVATWSCTVASQVAGSTSVERLKAGPRSSSGSVIDGSDL